MPILHSLGYQRHQIIGKAYPAITQSPLNEVRGYVVEISELDLEALDSYEGTEYKRVLLTVSSNNQEINAWVFIWDSYPHLLKNEDWNSDSFLNGKDVIFLKEEFNE